MTPLEWYALAVSGLLAFAAFRLLTQANDTYDWAMQVSLLLGELHRMQAENDNLRRELAEVKESEAWM